MHLVVHHVVQFEIIDVTDRGLLMERLAGFTVVQLGTTVFGQPGLTHVFVDLVDGGTVEDRGGELDTQFLAGPTKNRLINLSQVHTGRHTQRVQHHVHRTTVREEREVFLFHDLGHTTLVTVTTCHLVTDAQFALVGDIDLGHLDNTGGQLRTNGRVEHLAGLPSRDVTNLDQIVADDVSHQTVDLAVVRPLGDGHRGEINRVQQLLGELGTLLDDHVLGIVMDVMGNLAFQYSIQLGDGHFVQLVVLHLILVLDGLDQILVFSFGLAVLHQTGQGLGADDHTLHARGGLQGSVLHIAGLVTEDGAEQLLLRCRVGFALRRDLTDEDIALIDLGTDTDKTVLVQILGSLAGHVGDIVGQFLDTALGVTHLQSERFNMDRSI